MKDRYEEPLSGRYASEEMAHLFSEQRRYTTWRRLWVALARAQHLTGLPVSLEQVLEMEAAVQSIDLIEARRIEENTKHDVMAHILAYGRQCPKAKGIIHLGATSCFVTDNTDLILMREGLDILRGKLLSVISNLAAFAMEYRSLPCLGYTHFQPAQPVTVGKRAAVWIQDLLMDFEEMEQVRRGLRMRGAKGTTGTQAGFLTLYEGDHGKVERMEELISLEIGFSGTYPVTGQTYPRKVDVQIGNLLGQIAVSAMKFSNDVRLLQNRKEMEEPFTPGQVGSSAMPYKRNPIRCERMTSLSRLLISNTQNFALNAAEQWLERTLDDSANRRIAIPYGFLTADSILDIYRNVSGGLKVYPKTIRKNLEEELPFIASETILMKATGKGGDRQVLHERLRIHAMEANRNLRERGENILLDLIAKDPAFDFTKSELLKMTDPADFIGRSALQTEDYLRNSVFPLLESNPHVVGKCDLKI